MFRGLKLNLDTINRDMLGPASNISQSDKPENTPWNDPTTENRYNFLSNFHDSKSQSHVNQEDLNYQASIAQNNIPNIPCNPSISSIEHRGSAKNSYYEGDEQSLFLKKAILDSSGAVLEEQAKYDLPIPSSKENSVIFNINHPRMRDPINDTHTDQSEKCRLEYLESNESSLMIRGGIGIPFKSKPNQVKNKIPREKPIDLESNCSQGMIIKPPKRGYDMRQSSSIERFNRQSSSIERFNRQSNSIERFNRQSSSIDRFQRILHPISREVPRSSERDNKKHKCYVSQAMGKLYEIVNKNEEEKESTVKNFNLLSERSRQSSIYKPPDLQSDSDIKGAQIDQSNIELWENHEIASKIESEKKLIIDPDPHPEVQLTPIQVDQLDIDNKNLKYFKIDKDDPHPSKSSKSPKLSKSSKLSKKSKISKKLKEKLEIEKDDRSVHSQPLNYLGLAGSFEDRARTFNTKDPVRLEKIKRYLEKKKRRNFNRDIIYPTRKRVALMRPRVNGMFLPSTEKDLIKNELEAKKKRVKKKPGRKRKYDIIRKYSDIEDDIQKGRKIFKISRHK